MEELGGGEETEIDGEEGAELETHTSSEEEQRKTAMVNKDDELKDEVADIRKTQRSVHEPQPKETGLDMLDLPPPVEKNASPKK